MPNGDVSEISIAVKTIICTYYYILKCLNWALKGEELREYGKGR